MRLYPDNSSQIQFIDLLGVSPHILMLHEVPVSSSEKSWPYTVSKTVRILSMSPLSIARLYTRANCTHIRSTSLTYDPHKSNTTQYQPQWYYSSNSWPIYANQGYRDKCRHHRIGNIHSTHLNIHILHQYTLNIPPALHSLLALRQQPAGIEYSTPHT